jgi:hypothetical protein
VRENRNSDQLHAPCMLLYDEVRKGWVLKVLSVLNRLSVCTRSIKRKGRKKSGKYYELNFLPIAY